eukprot:symbB.v1.2.023868.t1/scaffold2212.1/size85679/8
MDLGVGRWLCQVGRACGCCEDGLEDKAQEPVLGRPEVWRPSAAREVQASSVWRPSASWRPLMESSTAYMEHRSGSLRLH